MATVTLGPEQDGHSVSASVGDTVVVRLPENPTTGYRWQVGGLDEPFVEQVEDTYDAGPTPAVGGGGTRELAFRIKAPAPTAIELEYRRPWEDAGTASDRWRVELAVT